VSETDSIPHRHHAAGKRRIRQWLDRPVTAPSPEPVFTAANIHYVDGTLVVTGAGCKQGVDIAHDGTWGYHPLIISLANIVETGRPSAAPRRNGS
jgi:hypothetical protein